jgi:hypothetical protein
MMRPENRPTPIRREKAYGAGCPALDFETWKSTKTDPAKNATRPDPSWELKAET